MKLRDLVVGLTQNEDLNFLLTNRIPRIQLTRFMGWFSKIEHAWVREASMAIWRAFADLDLHDAKTTQFRSLHDCFTRELREGARPIWPEPNMLVSPCDAIVGAFGRIRHAQVYQAKGFPYRLDELLGEAVKTTDFEEGSFVTLRLTSSMYHHFHALENCMVEEVVYFSGDTWNVNPIALKRVERLFCKNERVLLRLRLRTTNQPIALVAVAAVLVASVRLRFLDTALNLRYRGPNRFKCAARFEKGQAMGHFEHGSTILVFAPKGFEFAESVQEGNRIRMGEPLLKPASG